MTILGVSTCETVPGIRLYQLPRMLTALLDVAVPISGHDDVAFFKRRR